MTTKSPITDQFFEDIWDVFCRSEGFAEFKLQRALEAAAPLLTAALEGEVERLKAKAAERREQAARYQRDIMKMVTHCEERDARIAALTAPPSEEEISTIASIRWPHDQSPAADAACNELVAQILSQFLSNRTKGGEAVPTNMTEAQIKHMVSRFLQWRLPENFSPDCGIHFDADAAKKMNPQNHRYEPVGTNLFDATQADAMVRFMIEGLAQPPVEDAGGEGRVPDRETAWLVERRVTPPQYVSSRSEWPSFSPDPWRAERFSTEKEAWDFRLRIAPTDLRDECAPVEHVFINKVAPPPSPVAGGGEKWSCLARKSSMPDPQDCDWPLCGCDPYADKVIEALEECGALKEASSPSPPVAMPEWGALTGEQRKAVEEAHYAALYDGRHGSDRAQELYDDIRRALTPGVG